MTFEINTRIRHKLTKEQGIVVGYPTEYSDLYSSVKWDNIENNWPAGYVTPNYVLEAV